MQSTPRLGSVNAALLAIYFVPVWGRDALRVLTSPFFGFEDRAHAAAISYFRAVFDLGIDGLMLVSGLLATLKLVIAAGFVAYLIEFARALVMRREPNQETLDMVLLLALGAIMLWAWPGFALGDASVTRLHATQFLLLSGAAIVILAERQILVTVEETTSVPTPAPPVITPATQQA
jgi:hypothetical protein